MFRFAVALIFGGALVLASDPSFARMRIRLSAPAPKPVTAQPAKPVVAAPQTRPATPVPVFVAVGARPFAAAPAAASAAAPPVQRAVSDNAPYGPLQFDPELANTDEKPAANVATKEPVKDAVAGKDTAAGKDQAIGKEPAKAVAATEPPKPQPASKNVRMAQPSTAAAAQTARTPAINVCYVQLSGECVPF